MKIEGAGFFHVEEEFIVLMLGQLHRHGDGADGDEAESRNQRPTPKTAASKRANEGESEETMRSKAVRPSFITDGAMTVQASALYLLKLVNLFALVLHASTHLYRAHGLF